MEFMNRSGRPAPATSTPASSPASNSSRSRRRVPLLSGQVIANIILLIGIVTLVAGTALLMGVGRSASEASSVRDEGMQAVFLNGGQVYFGNIDDLNDSFLRLTNIYYLRVNQQVQPDSNSTAKANDISLVKLGCELHGPKDEMLINRDQVVFWENLKDDGQVAEAVKAYVKENPKGQDCSAANQSTTQETTDTKKDQ
jgi:hypothetical protein